MKNQMQNPKIIYFTLVAMFIMFNHYLFAGPNEDLIKAVENGKTEYVAILIKNGATTNIENKYSIPLIEVAVQNDFWEIVKLLIETENTKNSDNIFEHVLLDAINSERKDVIESLLKRGVNLNYQNFDGSTPLILSSIKGNLEISTLLIKNGASINVINHHGRSALLESFEGKININLIKFLIENGADVNIGNTNHSSINNVLYSIYNYNQLDETVKIELVRLIIEKGFKLNEKDNKGRTVLMDGLSNDVSFEIIKLLIEKCDDINIQDNEGKNALMYSFSLLFEHKELNKESLKLIKMLIDRGADVNAKDFLGQNVLMRFFSETDSKFHENSYEIVKFLIDIGIDLKAKDRMNNSVLYYINSKRFDEITKKKIINILVENGAVSTLMDNLWEAVQAGDSLKFIEAIRNGAKIEDRQLEFIFWAQAAGRGYTNILKILIHEKLVTWIESPKILKYAAENGQLDVVKLLISIGNNQNTSINSYKCESLFIAFCKGGLIEYVQDLIDKGEDVNAKDCQDGTALMFAFEKGRLNIAKLLIEKGADINAKNHKNKTTLMFASGSGNLDVVRFLVEKGADINAKSNDNETAIMFASGSGNLDIVRLLVEKGADINVISQHNKTALLIAEENNYIKIVEYLKLIGAKTDIEFFNLVLCGDIEKIKSAIAGGANTNARNCYGSSALMCSILNWDINLAKLLIENRADINLKSENGENAFTLALSLGKLDIASYLLDNYKNSVERKLDCELAIQEAVWNNKMEVVKYLLDIGTNPYIERNGISLLFRSIVKGNVGIAKLLIEQGAFDKINDVKFKQKILFEAIGSDNIDLLKILIAKGADLNQVNENKEDPLKFAINHNLKKIVKFLKSKGIKE